MQKSRCREELCSLLKKVVIRALNTLLDTFVVRFRTRDAIYTNDGDNYFTARVTVSVSEQFFGWLCGLGNKVKIEAEK